MGVTVCLSIDQGELLRKYRGVEAGGRKGRGSDDEDMIRATGELDYFSAYIRLREPGKSEDKADVVRKEMDLEEYHSVTKADLLMARKGHRCEATDSRAMGLAMPWYRRGGASVEASIPWSHGGRVLVAKGAEEVENAKANSKYQDRIEGHKPRNFIRPVSTGFSSR
ncbi:hypothetical protein BHM03_00020222 [Ensete ventricosum]|nr:hypothetical protein BHM03_00020222 [Ensete ventricosum]